MIRIWFGYSRRIGECSGCEFGIKASDMVIRTQLTGNGKFDGTVSRYHIECWIGYIEYWAEQNPYNPIVRGGRPALKLTVEERKRRNDLQRQKSKLVKRKEHLLRNRLWESAKLVDEEINQIQGALDRMVEK